MNQQKREKLVKTKDVLQSLRMKLNVRQWILRLKKYEPNFCVVTLRWVGELSEEEECLRATWEKLGATHEGYLGREELKLVCKASGLEGVADELVQQLFERVGVDPDGRISFEQFLRLFRSGLGTPAAEVEHTNVLLTLLCLEC